MLIYFVCINLLGASGREISRSKIRVVRQGSIRENLEEFPISQNWGKCPQNELKRDLKPITSKPPSFLQTKAYPQYL